MNQSLITIENCYIFNKIKLKLKIINYLIHFIKKVLWTKVKFYLFFLTEILILIFIIEIYFLKYKLILRTGNKVEVTTFSFLISSFF